MFCGFCSNDQEEDNEIVIRSTNINDFNQRVNRNQVGQVMSLVETSCQYSMVYPSKYDFHINQCALNASKFTDPDFPPNETSIGMSIQNRRVIWKRVTEIVKNPVMVQNLIEPADVHQGNVGDCYFLASISSIAEVPSRIHKIFCN